MALFQLQAALACLLLALPTAAGGIVWEENYAAALERAKAEQKVVFIALNMDGERANDRLAAKTYKAGTLVELSRDTVNLACSAFEHSRGKCKRFGGITCQQHIRIDAAVREQHVKSDEQGFVIAPQHVFLAPDGRVILSVPYDVSEGELEWCWVTALKSVAPEGTWTYSKKARAPRRLVMDGVVDPAAVPGSAGRSLTREEALQLIEEVKRGMNAERRARALERIMTVDEPEAIEFVRAELRSGGSNRGAAGGGRGGRGGGAAAGRGNDRADRRPKHLHTMGVVSPQSYWEIAVEYADNSLVEVRAEAAVALEQLGAPEALKTVRAMLRQEEERRIEKNWIRALGTCGATDKKARTQLLKLASSEKDDLLRRNALVALGSLARNEAVDARLLEVLNDGTPRDRAAAALALAMTRDKQWVELLKAALETDEAKADAHLTAALEASQAVLEGAPLGALRAPLKEIAGDELERERTFGTAPRKPREGR